MRNIKEKQDKQVKRMLSLEKTAHEVTVGHAMVRALRLQVTAMSKQIADLEAQNRASKIRPAVHQVDR